MKSIHFVALAGLALNAHFTLAQTPPSSDQTVADDGWQPTTEINKLLPHWISFSGSYRTRVEDQHGIAFRPATDVHVLGQLFVGLKIQPASWITFFGQAQDSRIYLNGPVAKAPPYANTWDIHQAWGEVGNIEKYHFKVRVGRQELLFGDQRLVGSAPWLNNPRVFDAVLASFIYQGFRVDAFTSSVVNAVNGQLDHHKQENPFHGVYASSAKLIPKATVDAYVFWRLAPIGYAPAYPVSIKGKLDEKTFGFRVVGKLPDRFDYGLEMARQEGNFGSDSIGAWAGHWVVGRTFDTKTVPRILIEYNYASGTSDPTGSRIATFDQLYPSNHDKFGVADQIGWRNIRDVRTGIELKPFTKLKMSGMFHDFRLANAHDALYTSNGNPVARSLTGSAGTHVGEELDIQGLYTVNKAVQFGLGVGHVFPGEFLTKTTPGKSYTFPYVFVSYAF